MANRSRLVKMRISNIGCIGPEGLTIDMNKMLCLVGPNNVGKSTILRAYELAVGNAQFSTNDLCKRANGQNPFVEIWVHIPQGTPNIAEKWKTIEGNLCLVRSKWEWDPYLKKSRQTWDPEINNYSEDDKASGLDSVFNSRLPIPFRIGALEDPKEEHSRLMSLILEPISKKLESILADETSQLSKAILNVIDFAKIPVDEEKTKISSVSDEINKSHNQIFPNLSVDLSVGLEGIEIKPLDALKKGSKIKFKDSDDEIDWLQQGTGSQRALFWSILQVRSKLKTIEDKKTQIDKSKKEFEKKISKLVGERDKATKPETKKAKDDEIKELTLKIEELCKNENDGGEDSLGLPGYMLLIDEPEVGLHPNAIRAASRYLYNLSEEDTWQVMLSTHSPYFVDPLEDHTTIVRLNRTVKSPTPQSYISDEVEFSTDDKENLKMLNRFDQGVAEMFFGQYPILVEGDTEFVAFETVMHQQPDKYVFSERPIIVRARGKYTLDLLIKMLSHFKVNFGILHDSDTELNIDGKKNSAWKANLQLYESITKARKNGQRIVHRISIPNFETEHGIIGVISSKDKPWKMWNHIRSNEAARKSVNAILMDLLSPNCNQEPFSGDFETTLMKKVKSITPKEEKVKNNKPTKKTRKS